MWRAVLCRYHRSYTPRHQCNTPHGVLPRAVTIKQKWASGHAGSHWTGLLLLVPPLRGKINELSNVPVPVMLMPDDFKAYRKIKVDNHLFNKENLPSHFKFKDYCPLVFRNLRERFGIDDQDYQNSVTRSAPVYSDSHGRCGVRFLTSYDRRFVIKAVSSEDVAEIHNILKKYHQ
ncbi:phosphatidylinositol 5-phosphate 4-kinase type-2 beta-like, partial [Protobothrops mucrosquamatus]|uniref:phosphatidylinositol 5-phosphate 4-kinase type-2 beta-like n=1 Tax=Protobothrops mucrosquamatus TaxID=103944 RepID=UPI0007756065